MESKKTRIGKFLFSFLLIAFAPGVKAQDTLKVNLQQVLEIALSESPTIKIADKNIEKKKYVKKETIAGLVPQISASASYNRTLKKQVMYMNSGGKSGGFESMITEPITQLVKPLYDNAGIPFPDMTSSSSSSSSSDGGMEVGLDNNWSGGFSLSLPIFAPTLYKTIKMNNLDIELAVESARASRQDLVNQVTKAFYQYLLAKDSYKVMEVSYKQAEDNYNVIADKYAQGMVSEYDKIRADVQVRSIKPSLVQTRNAANLALLQLKVLMGIDTETEIEPDGSLNEYEMSMMSSEILNVDTASIENNTTIKQLNIQDRMLKNTLKLYRTSYMPNLALSAVYQWNAMNNDFNFSQYKWNPYSMIGISFSIPIFQGGATYHKVKQVRMDQQTLELNVLNTRRTLNMQMKTYVDNMKTSLEEVGSNKEAVNQATKGRDIALKRYEVGSGTIVELNDAELALTQAKLAYTQSIFNFVSAKADLDKVLGIDMVITDNKSSEE